MTNESPLKALMVVTLVVIVTSTLVSATVVLLRPVQLGNLMLQQGRTVLQLTGLPQTGIELTDAEVLERFRALDARVVDLATGRFESRMDPITFQARRAADDPEGSTAIPAEADRARLGRRAQHAVVYLVWGEDGLQRIVLPVYGMGMWSTIYGYISLEGDLNTIAGVLFHEQAETPGVGDRITHPQWLQKWQGRKIYDEEGVPRFAVVPGRVEPGSAAALHGVDAISGATVSTDAVTSLVQFWFGPWGFRGLLDHLREAPPRPPTAQEGR